MRHAGGRLVEQDQAGAADQRAANLDPSPVDHRQAGRITCLLGSNGSGKTTLIRSILGLTPPRKGRIVFDGREITHLPTHKVIAAGIACIPEGRKVFPKLTVEENLRLGAYQ